MAIVQPVAKESLGPEGKIVHVWLRKTFGKVESFVMTFAHAPRMFWWAGVSHLMEVKGLSIGKRTSDLMSFVVAKENACPYCVPGAELMLRLRGFSEREVATLRDRVECPGADKKTALLLRMAHRSARDSHRFGEADRRALLDAGLSAAQLVEAAYLCGSNGFGNRYCTGFQFMPETPIRMGLHPVFGWIVRPFFRVMLREMFREPKPA